MPLPPLYGHEGTRNRLVGAIASGRLPQVLLFEGPHGVGKQRLALSLAQALVCEQDAACGECRHCKLVLTLSHPDVHWFVPLEPSKRAVDQDRQIEAVEEALAEEMAVRRERPLYDAPSGMALHSIAAVRLLLRRLPYRPALARRKVFVIGDAERLVPQPGSEAAANALLKALEEPPRETVFVLTSAEPEALLLTIVSRVVRVRVARLADSIVALFAQRELGVSGQAELRQLVGLADGSPGRLLAEGVRGAAGGGGGAGVSAMAQRFLQAVEGGPVRQLAFALAQQPFQARGGFTGMLDGLLELLREQARAGRETGRVVAAIARVLEARGLAQGNVNPQLVSAVLAADLRASSGAPA